MRTTLDRLREMQEEDRRNAERERRFAAHQQTVDHMEARLAELVERDAPHKAPEIYARLADEYNNVLNGIREYWR